MSEMLIGVIIQTLAIISFLVKQLLDSKKNGYLTERKFDEAQRRFEDAQTKMLIALNTLIQTTTDVKTDTETIKERIWSQR